MRRGILIRGLTLIEVLAAMAIFAVIAGLATQLYVRTRKSMGRQTARAVNASQQLSLLAMVERDARVATRSLHRLGPFRQDLRTLILAMPAGLPGHGSRGSPAARYVVYKAEGAGPYRLTRRAYAGPDAKAALEEQIVAEELREVALRCDGPLLTVQWASLTPDDELVDLEMQTAICMRNYR
ncbi:MAG: type II secretion system protein J [Armatimonadota bacterium]